MAAYWLELSQDSTLIQGTCFELLRLWATTHTLHPGLPIRKEHIILLPFHLLTGVLWDLMEYLQFFAFVEESNKLSRQNYNMSPRSNN